LGQILVNGTFTFALTVQLSVGETTLGTQVADLGYDKLFTPKPAFIGDTTRAISEVSALKDSKSRPTPGIVIFEHELINQRDEVYCRCTRAALLRRVRL
jgi:acyl dehydratase